MDFNDYASTPERNIPWKLVALGAGSVLLVLIIVAVVFRVIGSNQISVTLIERDEEAQAELLIEQCDGEEECESEAMQDAAAITGDAAYCDELEGEMYDECLWGIATAEQDAELCQKLIAEHSRALCADTIYRVLAYQMDDVSYCDQLSTQEKIEGCRNTIEPITVDTCSDKDHGAEYCEYLQVSEKARQQKDRQVCETLSDEYREDCREAVLVDDPDGDGLSTDKETNKYGSDPYNEDTDGDGYADGDEVEAGYSPTGSGEL